MKSWPIVRCASRHLKVPLGTLRVPIGTHHHQGSLIMFCVFGHFSDPFFTLFNTQKDLFIKLGNSNMSCPFVKKVTCITIFKRRKKKIDQIKISQSHICSSLKLEAFGHALSPLFGTSKNHSFFSKKKINNNNNNSFKK